MRWRVEKTYYLMDGKKPIVKIWHEPDSDCFVVWYKSWGNMGSYQTYGEAKKVGEDLFKEWKAKQEGKK